MTEARRRDFVQATLEDLVETTSDIGDEGEEDDLHSCSTFSLQQCIDEFRARRLRRNSVPFSEQRDEQQQQQHATEKSAALVDAELINQNRSNKEHERQYKPCKNGFCYCFTSDSGDGGCGIANTTHMARAAAYSFRPHRRSRKSDCGQTTIQLQQETKPTKKQNKERRSAPACLKTNVPINTEISKSFTSNKKQNSRRPLTAVSRLETTTHDAPLIHIIQELRDNCVISEVRVNKDKLQAKKRIPKRQLNLEDATLIVSDVEQNETPMDMENSFKMIETLSGDSIPITRLEINSKSPSRKPGAGRLLQKRLTHANIQYKPRDMNQAPPKPPRVSTGSQPQSSSSSGITISPSLREAERIVDDFLIKKGVPVPKTSKQQIKQTKKRLSFPLTNLESQTHIPTCPSLSDIESIVNTKKMQKTIYDKNMAKQSEQIIKDIKFGWQEPKVSEMLNYDTNGNRKQFKSQAAQAEPQSIGWQIPPKLSLDTVDGAVRHNLASNLAIKDTPIKRQFQAKRNNSINKFTWPNIKTWSSSQKCPRSFLKQSKKKILKLVTPKKDNKVRESFQARKTPYRNVGIQTSPQDFSQYEHCTNNAAQSPPGSYHSATAIQNSNDVTPQDSTATSNMNSRSNNTSDSFQFDFTRKVSSPPKKSISTLRSTQRKLDFPCVSGTSGMAERSTTFSGARRQAAAEQTYRSYHTDLDQDVTISKMGFILSNIRARLEASDEHAVRTFEEIERREQRQHHLMGFDCPDSRGIRHKTNVDVHARVTHIDRTGAGAHHEPIYSEIEEDSIHVTESPQFDNKTGMESTSSVAPATTSAIDIETLYAKVNKSSKNAPIKPAANSIALGKFLHDSIRRQHLQAQNQTLPVVIEPSVSYVSYSSPPFETSSQHTNYDSLSHCQSLNNIRVMEQHSPPKRNRNLSKSDLSLHRSEIFHENLCRSELIVESGALQRLEKVDNHLSNRLEDELDSDNVSYDFPDEQLNEAIAKTSIINSPQKFLTKPAKPNLNVCPLNATLPGEELDSSLHCTRYVIQNTNSSSCPVTPRKCYNTPNNVITESNSQPERLNEAKYDLIRNSTIETGTALTRYKRLKQALQKSFRKSKNFVKTRRASLPQVDTYAYITINETPKLTTRTLTPTPQPLPMPLSPTPTKLSTSCLYLDELFKLDEASTVNEQIARAVSICRQLPELESSHEMVEAERLLLFSTLRRDITKLKIHSAKSENVYERNFSIKTMRLPVNLEVNLDGYFNYYFTITFECDGRIYSTPSTVYRHGEVVFQNIDHVLNMKKLCIDAEEPCINCNIFMLRLRKISDVTPAIGDTNDEFPPHDITPLPSTPLSSASSLDGIASRFRLYASFCLSANSFKPYKLINNATNNSNETNQRNMISLSASNYCKIPLKLCSSSETTTTAADIIVNAIATVYFPQNSFNGFLHVQNPFSQHNWNWRWCSLIGLQLQIWTDANGLSESPLMSLELDANLQMLPISQCNRELCARTRSFCLQCLTKKTYADEGAIAAVFFAADNDAELNQWLQHLNETFDFIVKWMQ